MYLYSVEIYNFRGIRHLSIDFEADSNVLIGENSWGKSSLLRALWMALGQGEELCHFQVEDLYVPLELLQHRGTNSSIFSDLAHLDSILSNYQEDKADHNCEHKKNDLISIDLIFKESAYGAVASSKRLQRLEEAWYMGDDGLHLLHWHIKASFENGSFITRHELLDKQQRVIGPHSEHLIKQIIRMNPVLRIRDSRMMHIEHEEEHLNNSDFIEQSESIYKLGDSDNLHAKDVISGLQTLNTIVSKYLVEYSGASKLKNRNNSPRTVRDIVNQPLSVDSLSSLRRNLQKKGITRAKIILSFIASGLLLAKGGRKIDKRARPIVILEDIEGRFHPSLLSSFYSLLEVLPVQKIITTNSGDLLSATPILALRRLCRQDGDTRCFKVDQNYLSYDDLRRIAFHVRVNRPMTLFARVWILVEGETEVWMLTEIARILGIGLYSKGIRLIEFAQCGLNPLLKFAHDLGISAYVLTDGDEAGVKYARTVESFYGKENLKHHLLLLPSPDIEHFFYRNGYANIFMREANVHQPLKKGLTVDKIISMAIKRKTKPGLALSIVEEIQRRGIDGIPKSLKQMYSRIGNLARYEVSQD